MAKNIKSEKANEQLSKPIDQTHGREPRKPAKALGLVTLSANFDDPLPEEIQAAFEGRS